MNSRIQHALDGELGIHELSSVERAELKGVETTLGRVVDTLPEAGIDTWPGVRRRLLAEARSHRKRGVLAWLMETRQVSIRWRPAYGLMAAVLLIAVVGGLQIFRRAGEPPSRPATQQVLVQFRLEAPGANRVTLAGDFTEWKPAYSLRKSSSGVWTVVVPLDPGVHDYAFVVDGQQWIADPLAPAVADGFGGMNSRLAVLTPDTR